MSTGPISADRLVRQRTQSTRDYHTHNARTHAFSVFAQPSTSVAVAVSLSELTLQPHRFAFDTTGQEAVVVWLLYFANETNGFAAAAERTVDHILSYMRSSPTWAYNGGTRSWGDLGNNGKWMVTSGANFETRGNMHYRSGLNAIPLLEWYKRNPDDVFLLGIGLGAVAGQMGSIDENGAPSMMLHMEPHILDYDPHS